jgi:putative transposase
VHMRYAQHSNWKRSLTGHVWESRFFSCPLDEGHLWAAVRYVERNPVRAGMVQRAEDYPWSSAAAHCGHTQDALLSDPCGLVERVPDWSAWLAGEEDQTAVELIRKSTRTGRPAGGEAFLDKLERLLGRRLRPLKPGRPRKTPAPDRAPPDK